MYRLSITKSFLLLIVIYLTFISLGLPDSLLGVAWPSMYKALQTPVHYAGIISMIVGIGTVVSSLLSTKLIRIFGTTAIVIISVWLTAIALLGFSWSSNFIFLCLLAIPLGLGAGSVDASLNNYVATHYAARHMNWLHCFWGVGAAIGPMIMARYLSIGKPWNNGYYTIGLIQVGLAIALIASIPLWAKPSKKRLIIEEGRAGAPSWKEALNAPGLRQALMVFFCYCSVESTFGLWGASYLTFTRGLAPDHAARLVSIYYGGITAGRFLSGFLTTKWTNRQLVYGGQSLIALGLVILLLPYKVALLPSFFFIGLGCAPIFPCLLHETPRNFGKRLSQAVMGMQMASAYVGVTFMPLLFGKLASYLGHTSLLAFIAVLLVVQIWMTGELNRKTAKTHSDET